MAIHQATLVPTEPLVPISASRSVAVHGDTVVVGDPSRTTMFGRGSGAVYVFRRSAEGWVQETELLNPDPQSLILFGETVAVSGDFLAIGAPSNGPNARFPGSVFCYTRSGNTWGSEMRLRPSSPVASGRFGASLALDRNMLLVGRPFVQPCVFAFQHDGTIWQPAGTMLNDDAPGGDDFGASVGYSFDTAQAIVGAPSLKIGSIFPGAAYIFTRDGFGGWRKLARLLPDRLNNAMDFGVAVAVSGLRALVGAQFATVADVEVGAAYIFEAQGDGWSPVPVQTLRAGDPAIGDAFGNSVALTATAAVIGSPGDELPTGGSVRSAYVFEREGTTWLQTAKLSKPDIPDDANIENVALADNTVVLSLNKPASGGAASIYRKTNGTWLEETTLMPREGSQFDQFGAAVSLSGDVLAVGAPSDDAGRALVAGSTYIFTRTASGWAQQRRLTAPTPSLLAQMGFSLALTGDTLLVGSPPRPQDGPEESGRVYAFRRNGSEWDLEATLTPSDAVAKKFGFGWAVAISGGTAIVGARFADTERGGKTGAAYIFVKQGSHWTEQAKLVGSAVAPGHFSGTAVAIDGNTAVMGSPAGFGAAPSTGSAYVFVRSGTSWNQQAVLAAANPLARDNLGTSVAIVGDRVVTGAPGKPSGPPNAGYACVFRRSGTAWSQEAKLAPPQTPTRFGGSCAMTADGRIVVGDRSTRKAYVFARQGGSWQQADTIDGTLALSFGSSVAVSATTCVIGAPFASTAHGPSGAVLVFQLQ
jgi:FG-GAP repeat